MRRRVCVLVALALLGSAAPAVANPYNAPTKTFRHHRTPPLAPIARAALKLRGIPYVWAGSSLSGFDCSGLTQYVWGEFGVSLSHYTGTQISVGYQVPGVRWAKAGDLLFPSYGHVMMYLGRKKVIHAPHTGDVVRVVSVYDRSYIEIRRPEGRKAIMARTVKHRHRPEVVYRVNMR